MKLTIVEREVYDVSVCKDKNRCTFLQKPCGNRIRIRLLVRTVRQNLEDFIILDLETGVKEEKSGGVVGGEGECGVDVVGLLVGLKGQRSRSRVTETVMAPVFALL